ncbi:MAG: Rrf2 family transcriptional regulator [Myxococcota bacterium]|nr:Rrf2 family transcriptional regulator [Myxococcota bacterium]
MKITRLEQQAVRLALCLAEKESMTLPELSEKEHLTEALVAKVMGKLRRGGVVIAIRGRVGGYRLTAPPEAISIAAVWRALGRPLLHGCFNSGDETAVNPCHRVADCSLRPVWQYLETRVTSVLDHLTLADLLEREKNVRSKIGAP